MLENNKRDALDSARREFRDQLIDAGLLVSMGVDGLYGRGAAFESIVEGIDAVIREKMHEVHGDGPRVLRFPPAFSRESFEKTDYVASFPQLTGAISTFSGDGPAHRALLEDREAGRPWDGHLTPAGTMLVSAACHPAYATLAVAVPAPGELLDVYGYCFRHEPAVDPARMQVFRMHEVVFVGTPELARGHRDAWIQHGLAVLNDLGLQALAVIANDPFFGRPGKLLAANQRDEGLKTELVVRLYGDLDEGTAIVSANCHGDHFGQKFGLTTPDGSIANSACVGFGMERVALALLRTHGLDLDAWPPGVRARMSW